ncbi:MAG TPA: MFS transporter, partial [Pseudoxanthomonas sp.]|nr:MFS transporter [Pseudoxanthomonas sp.]
MSMPSLSGAPAAALPPPRRYALAMAALTLGGFAIGTSEFASMGLMPNMVASLGVTEPQVGHVISA